MKKLVYLVPAIMMIGLIGLFSACSSDAAPEPPKESNLSEASLLVVTTYGPNDGGRLAFEALCNDFTASTGAAIVDASADSTEEWKQSVLASFEDNSEPDVLFFFTGPDMEKLIQNGKFVSLEEIRASYPDYASNINLAVMEGLKAADGQGYAVPIKGYWERLFVNADIFDELDLELPKTYEDLFTMTPILLKAGYIPIAASLAEVPHYLFEALLFNYTGPAQHHNIPDNPEDLPESWLMALEQFPAMYEAGVFPFEEQAPTHADAFELFQSKQAAMILDGDWSAPYVRDAEQVVVIDFPAIPDGVRKNTDLISGFSMGFYISKKAWDDPAKREAAVAFVEFITSNESIMRLNVSGAAMPISIASSGGTVQENSDATPLRRSIDALNEETTAFVGAVADEAPIEARSWLFSRILPLARGEMSAEETLKGFIEVYNQHKEK